MYENNNETNSNTVAAIGIGVGIGVAIVIVDQVIYHKFMCEEKKVKVGIFKKRRALVDKSTGKVVKFL